MIDFAALKNRRPGTDPKTIARMCVGGGGEDADAMRDSVAPKQEHHKKARTKEEPKKFSPVDGILLTGWCWGCLWYSVDAPGSEKEAHWCGYHKTKDGGFEFKRIVEAVRIKQCPALKAGRVSIHGWKARRK